MNEVDLIKKNYNVRKQGKPLTLQWSFKKVAQKIAGFLKHTYTIVTGNTGSGKTKFTKFLTLTSILEFKKEYPNRNVKVMWFALEETKEYFYLSILSHLIYEKYNKIYSVQDLLSYFKQIDEIFELDLDTLQRELDDIKKVFQCIDHIYNPYGIYKEVRAYMHTIGEDIVEDGKIIGYKYNDDDDYVFVVVDHFTLMTSEKGKTQWESLENFSKEYMLNQMVKRFGCIGILIQQQASETEKNEYYQGEAVANKVKPTLNGLGLYKNTQQDCTMAVGIFNPARYGIRTYNGFTILEDHSLRFIIVLKDRYFGCDGFEIPLKFNGKINHFEEL